MLTIRNTSVFHGPSLWAPVRAIVLEVDIGELEDRLSRQTPVFFERLVTLVPSLSEFGSVVSQPEGGLKRLLLDRLGLALQQMAGSSVSFAQTLPTAARGVYTVVYEYQHEDVGIAVGVLASRLLNHFLYSSEPELDFAHELEKIARIARRQTYPQIMNGLLSVAKRRGIPILPLQRSPAIVQLGNGRYQRRLHRDGTVTSDTGHLAGIIAQHKGLTNRLLREAGLPVPLSHVIRSADDAAQAAATIGYPVVVKPLDGNHARGVWIDARDEAEVREAFPRAMNESRSGQVIVERFIPGKIYRILVVGDQVVAVVERIPAHVIGDGRHTVAELVEITNADPRRGIRREKPLTLISIDELALKILARNGLGLHRVPEEGRFVPLKLTCSLNLDGTSGGTNIDRTEEIHPDNAAIARQATKVIGLDIAGIDFITPDIARSAFDQGGAINEVNSHPLIRFHTHPAEGQPRDVERAVIDLLFPLGQPVRVPIIAVTGTNDTATTTRLIAHILTTAGKQVGLTTSDGIYIDRIRIASGNQTGPESARKVLRNPAIDFAVLETARDGILRAGLGFSQCDVAVVTNIGGDYPGPDGIAVLDEIARVTAVVPRAVAEGGTSVLNADDEWTLRIADVAGGEILYFTLDARNPVIVQHVRQGGRAVVLQQSPAGDMVTLLAGEEETALVLATEIPAPHDGGSRVDTASVLAAVAAALARQVPLETIRTALRNAFVPGDETGSRAGHRADDASGS
jgi:cyanophycin synthetase